MLQHDILVAVGRTLGTFTGPYAQATVFQHVVYLIAIIFATTAVALLSAPAAWHRLLFTVLRFLMPLQRREHNRQLTVA